MAGLGRSESAKVPEELGDLAGILYDQAPGASDPDDPSASNDATPDPEVVPAEGAEK
jgi:cytochrome c biogenesis protein